MRATPREMEASSALARALLELIDAVEEGRLVRRPPPKHGETPSERALARLFPAGVGAKPLMASREAAAYLGIGARKLWDLTSPRGPVPSVRVGTLVRYSVKDLDAAIDRMKDKPKGPQA